MNDFDPLTPASYKFWATEHVRFADLDIMGHVNNKAYATYYESARIAYAAARGMEDRQKIGMALARLEIDYRKEIRFPALLRLGVSLRKLGRSSITLACAVFDGDICASTSMAVLVRFDLETRKSMPFPNEERQALVGDL
jgi:acyl-CoA thioester hydrolase